MVGGLALVRASTPCSRPQAVTYFPVPQPLTPRFPAPTPVLEVMRPRQQSPPPQMIFGRVERLSQPPMMMVCAGQPSLVPPTATQMQQLQRQVTQSLAPRELLPAPSPMRLSQHSLPAGAASAVRAGNQSPRQSCNRRSFCGVSPAERAVVSYFPGKALSSTIYSFVPTPLSAWPAASASCGSWVPWPVTAPSPEEISPWLRAAQHFHLNRDFDLSKAAGMTGRLSLAELMAVMKRESSGKRTIQALADKLMLHRMLENLSIPQLPSLYSVQCRVNPQDVERLVDAHLSEPGSRDIVLKPSHLSNGNGVLVISRVRPEERTGTITYLVNHMEQYLQQNAGSHESLALQSLTPGFLVQPRYQSVVAFKTPLELRVIALWGKARMGLWWWGRNAGAANEAPHRNVWLVRKPAKGGELADSDGWEVIHEHSGKNPGFENALALFRRHMPAMAATAEVMAKAFGAPFLRCDFFVGSAEWGVRLNEVAYGCGVDYRALAEENGVRKIVDDAPFIARILQEGMQVCQTVRDPGEFLSKVGAEGATYAKMSVTPVRKTLEPLFSSPNVLVATSDKEAEKSAVPEELCRTMGPSENVLHRCRSFEAPMIATPIGLQAGGASSWFRAGSVGPGAALDVATPSRLSARPSRHLLLSAQPSVPFGLRY